MMSASKLLSLSPAQQANVVAAIDISQIQGRDLKRKFARIQKKQAGFTLLELLVVVAILAVLGGLAIGAYGDKTSQAAKGSATNAIASTSSMVQTFLSTARTLPSNLDTLVCANAADADYIVAATSTTDYGGGSDLAGVSGGLGAKLAGKMTRLVIPDAMADGLENAGITRLRYALRTTCGDAGANVGGLVTPAADTDVGKGTGVALAAGDPEYPTGNLSAADIPNRGFDFPASTTGNRGRGYAKTVTGGNNHVLQVWDRGNSGSNNLKVGAGADDVLVSLGLGNFATMFTDAGNRVASSAPFYGDVARDKYSRYVALIKLGTAAPAATTSAVLVQAELDAGTALAKAQFITVIDARGDFLDEEYAEANGQKV